jgi:hypothetical protein
MGLLDDAIREHLELKRRSGADPGEIARMEQEALGPARREPIEAMPAPQPSQSGQHALHPHEGSTHYDDEPLYEDVLEEPPPPAPSAPAAAEPAASDQPTQQFSLGELEEAHGAPASAPEEPPAGRGEPAPPPAPERDDGAEIVPADAEPGDDDVLEETPEFLQETPEHDRLWFEQKPPRDFDF